MIYPLEQNAVKSDSGVTRERPYHSKLREEQAEETRLRIRASARRLFEARGFAGATVTEIAADAGVSPQTVYAAFGGKGGIVGSMLEELEQSIGMEAWIDRMVREPNPETQLRLFVAFNRTMYESGASILRAMVEGMGLPEVATAAARGNEARRAGTVQLVELLSEKGALRPGLSVTEAAELLWLLTSAEQFLHATGSLQWSPARYEQRLADLLTRELLDPATT